MAEGSNFPSGPRYRSGLKENGSGNTAWGGHDHVAEKIEKTYSVMSYGPGTEQSMFSPNSSESGATYHRLDMIKAPLGMK